MSKDSPALPQAGNITQVDLTNNNSTCNNLNVCERFTCSARLNCKFLPPVEGRFDFWYGKCPARRRVQS
jgi:hypothetical protein